MSGSQGGSLACRWNSVHIGSPLRPSRTCSQSIVLGHQGREHYQAPTYHGAPSAPCWIHARAQSFARAPSPQGGWALRNELGEKVDCEVLHGHGSRTHPSASPSDPYSTSPEGSGRPAHSKAHGSETWQAPQQHKDEERRAGSL